MTSERLDFNTSDGEDLMGYASFELNGYRFECWQPRHGEAPREMVIRVFDPKGEKVREDKTPMFHPNMWGVDVEDIQTMETKTEEIIKELGIE